MATGPFLMAMGMSFGLYDWQFYAIVGIMDFFDALAGGVILVFALEFISVSLWVLRIPLLRFWYPYPEKMYDSRFANWKVKKIHDPHGKRHQHDITPPLATKLEPGQWCPQTNN